MQPTFLGIERVLQIHASLIDHYGGAYGVRDMGLLQSAISQPPASFGGQFLHSDLFSMAAAYLFHLVKNHPFIDGNKRIGAATAIIFLSLNGIEIEADEDGLVEMTLAVACGDQNKAQIAQFFRAKVVASDG